jgi:hypothetical protein
MENGKCKLAPSHRRSSQLTLNFEFQFELQLMIHSICRFKRKILTQCERANSIDHIAKDKTVTIGWQIKADFRSQQVN